MNAKSTELARRWLRKAGHDLVTARQTLLLADAPTDTVCFHAQQAVEKALKALLTVHEVPVQRVHDLVRLLDFVLPFAPDLDSYRETFAEMTNYAVGVRYPDDECEPSREDADRAMAVADEVVVRVNRAVANAAPKEP